MDEVRDRLYYAWVPGPWWAVLPDTTDVYGAVIDEIECRLCGETRSLPPYNHVTGEFDETEVRLFVLDARRHWESHVAPLTEPVTYFLQPGVGQFKTECRGSWADVLVSVPYLIQEGDRRPPVAVIRSVLQLGESNAGMSGGVEWPRADLADIACARIQADLMSRLRLDAIEAPA